MRLAIGDIVRDRSDEALGTVAGLGRTDGPSLVLVSVSGRGTRVARPGNVELVARGKRPASTARSVAVLALFACGLVGAYLTASAVGQLGGHWLVQFAAGLGAFQSAGLVLKAFGSATGPRRFRV